jgi:hypothetical protein
MKKAKPRSARSSGKNINATPPNPRQLRQIIVGLIALGTVAAALWALQKHSAHSPTTTPPAYVSHPRGTLTFNKDVAPIIFNKCSFCHRPGQSAPFSLLAIKDVRNRAKTIHRVVESGYMPPWLPEPGNGQFAGDLSLTSEQRGVIQQWLAEGAPEGRPEDLPDLPKWRDDWQLGPPDLVVSLPSAYTLAAEGRDVYRNFVVPIPGSENRSVRAVEFHPGNSKVVHHAFVEVDPSRRSRYLTGSSRPPGFDGMELPPSVHMPMGQALGWQPGKPAMQSPADLPWVLEKGSDLVLQLHLHPSGKPEAVQPSVGFYFTDRTPTNSLFLIKLTRYTIDIPPGERNYWIENSYVLPVDIDLLRINPHTHYLGKQLEGWAVLPDGSRRELLLIRNWDFNWQGDYLYKERIPLPKGTTLHMRFSYDNSADNPHNPNQPPKRVRFGLQSTDEMGELWFQVLPRNRNDLALLSQDFFAKCVRDNMEAFTARLQSDPNDATAHTKLASALLSLGRVDEAVQHLRTAIGLDPTNALPHSLLGGIYRRQELLPQAQAEFEAVLRADPQDYEAQGSLGLIAMRQGRFGEAEACFEKALKINPEDPVAQRCLDALRNPSASSPQLPLGP